MDERHRSAFQPWADKKWIEAELGSYDNARRYVAVIQDERGYPPPGELDKAPPDGPKPPSIHSVVLADDYERLQAAASKAYRALSNMGRTGRDPADAKWAREALGVLRDGLTGRSDA